MWMKTREDRGRDFWRMKSMNTHIGKMMGFIFLYESVGLLNVFKIYYIIYNINKYLRRD